MVAVAALASCRCHSRLVPGSAGGTLQGRHSGVTPGQPHRGWGKATAKSAHWGCGTRAVPTAPVPVPAQPQGLPLSTGAASRTQGLTLPHICSRMGPTRKAARGGRGMGLQDVQLLLPGCRSSPRGPPAAAQLSVQSLIVHCNELCSVHLPAAGTGRAGKARPGFPFCSKGHGKGPQPPIEPH